MRGERERGVHDESALVDVEEVGRVGVERHGMTHGRDTAPADGYGVVVFKGGEEGLVACDLSCLVHLIERESGRSAGIPCLSAYTSLFFFIFAMYSSPKDQ